MSLGGILVGFSGHIVHSLINITFKKSSLYQQSLDLVKTHPVVIEELGEPIIDMGNREKQENFQGNDDNGIWTRIPLLGKKSTGWMKYWVKTGEDGESTFVNRVEVKFKHIKNRSLLIHKNEDN